MSTAPTLPPLPVRWYSITRDGAATLCVDEADAVAVAAESDIAWPNNAPHRAVQLVDAAHAAALAQRVEELEREVEYYRAGVERREPRWVPARIRLSGPVRGDFPIGHTTVASAGEHDCQSNRNGAVSVIAENGQALGVKPAEFVVVAWRENTPDAARKGEQQHG